jgi:hypothetical protein
MINYKTPTIAKIEMKGFMPVKNHPDILELFEKMDGYETLTEFLMGDINADCMAKSLESLEFLSYLGIRNDISLDEGDFPFQFDGFQLPETKAGKTIINLEFLFKNLKTINIYKKVFFESNNVEKRYMIIKSLSSILKRNDINYFLISSQFNIISEVITGFNSADITVKVICF